MTKQIAEIPLKELIDVLGLYMDQQYADNIWDLISCLEIRLEAQPDTKVGDTLKSIYTEK